MKLDKSIKKLVSICTLMLFLCGLSVPVMAIEISGDSSSISNTQLLKKSKSSFKKSKFKKSKYKKPKIKKYKSSKTRMFRNAILFRSFIKYALVFIGVVAIIIIAIIIIKKRRF